MSERLSDLPAYTDYVSTADAVSRAKPRWPFVIIAVLGALLIVAPILTGMFPRAVEAQAMIESFSPYVTVSSVADYRGDIKALDGAHADIRALRDRGLENGRYDRVDRFVRDYPRIRSDITSMIDSIDAERGNYQRLAALPPLGALPWLLALPGVVLLGAGIIGFRRAADGHRAGGSRILAGAAALVLIVTPVAGGLFSAATAAQPVLDGFGPILTHEQVRSLQGYFITLVAADGELNGRYVSAVRDAHPDADLTDITALQARWQPMTARFAALVGAMNDNVDHFDAATALNDATKSLGFNAFRGLGWFYLIPGVIALAAAAAGIRHRNPALRTTPDNVGETP
ncbi:hypothetical protein [Nocardia miyunensis]|uniref:hypothetical protein n=1 Tax=Nocardia miyunensis TaxID=282684 RepID=UPI00082ED393|nr:hypothetical protein [Nocardia miyunensis]